MFLLFFFESPVPRTGISEVASVGPLASGNASDASWVARLAASACAFACGEGSRKKTWTCICVFAPPGKKRKSSSDRLPLKPRAENNILKQMEVGRVTALTSSVAWKNTASEVSEVAVCQWYSKV